MKELFTELKVYTDEKKEELLKVNVIDKKIQDLDRDRQRELKKVHPVYNSTEKIKSGLKELNRRLT